MLGCFRGGKGGAAIDVLHLIDRLEALITSATLVPMTAKRMINEAEALEIIDQLRIAIPEELRQAKRVNQERERMLSDAQAEADRIIANAQQQAALMLQESELVKAAERQRDDIIDDARSEAARIVDEAQARADELHRDADEYAFEVLSTLENELNKHLVAVRKGRALLERIGRQTVPQ